MTIQDHNRRAWDAQVASGCVWTVHVSDEEIARARQGAFALYLTPTKPVPAAWFPPLAGARVLGLASGGGQQGPLLAAAGAEVTIFDNSPQQLAQDRLMAERHGLRIATVLGDMADLSAFTDGAFDLIVHPVSNCFAPKVRPVWREAFRVLKPGGALLSGVNNPLMYALDQDAYAREALIIRYPLPYADTDVYPPEEIARRFEAGIPLEFGHTLEDQIGGQLDAGFLLAGFYEDINRTDGQEPLDRFMPQYIATRAVKPA